MRLIIGNVQTPANPLLRAVSLILGAVVLVAALFFGALVFIFVIGFVAIAAAVAAARLWWIRRRLERAAVGAQGQPAGQPQRNAGAGRVIEGEFADISEGPGQRDESAQSGSHSESQRGSH